MQQNDAFATQANDPELLLQQDTTIESQRNNLAPIPITQPQSQLFTDPSIHKLNRSLSMPNPWSQASPSISQPLRRSRSSTTCAGIFCGTKNWKNSYLRKPGDTIF